jgi:hypothetical protein
MTSSKRTVGPSGLLRSAGAIPSKRFDTFIVLARLSPFSDAEIALARTLNDGFQQRAILLSARELEPYRIYERTNRDTDLDLRGNSPMELTRATARLYFTAPANVQAPRNDANNA